MELNHKCWNPIGELSLLLKQNNLISLRRCCYLEPLAELNIKDFLKIDNLIDYISNYNDDPQIRDEYKDICFICNLPKKIEKITVGLSKACNLNCYHCFYEDSHTDTKEIKELYFSTLNKIKGLHLKEIRLNDRGEPFYYYHETTNYLKSLSLDDTQSVSFITNLSTLNEFRIKELKTISEKTKIQYKIGVSFDGLTKESYESIRIGASFEKVVNNLKIFVREFGPDIISINYVIKQPNFNDKNIHEFFIRNFNIKNVFITYDIYDNEAKKVFEEL